MGLGHGALPALWCLTWFLHAGSDLKSSPGEQRRRADFVARRGDNETPRLAASVIKRKQSGFEHGSPRARERDIILVAFVASAKGSKRECDCASMG